MHATEKIELDTHTTSKTFHPWNVKHGVSEFEVAYRFDSVGKIEMVDRKETHGRYEILAYVGSTATCVWRGNGEGEWGEVFMDFHRAWDLALGGSGQGWSS